MALLKKLSRIGNSYGIILPADVLKVVGLDENSEVEITINQKKQIIIKPTHLKDHKIMNTFMGVLEDYDDTFKKLAK